MKTEAKQKKIEYTSNIFQPLVNLTFIFQVLSVIIIMFTLVICFINIMILFCTLTPF